MTRDAAQSQRELIDEIAACIPATFYADLPLPERVKLVVEAWRRAVDIIQQMDAKQC
jgi:hypothetical protein